MMAQRLCRILQAAVAVFGFSTVALAQDARTVTEPVIPTSCTVLQAQQAIVNGEPTTETTLDTARVQSALTACTSGQAVELALGGANNAFLVGPLTVPTGVTLLVDGGVTMFASRNPADYQVTTAGVETCGTVGTAGNGCLAVITMSGANAGIMGYGVIDGRGQDKLLIGGAPATYSWWDNAGNAQLRSGGAQNNPILVSANAANLILYKITFRNSPMFHVKWTGNITNKTGFTAWGVKVITPFSARNTDGIDPSGLNISILNSSLSDGDDDVAVSASSAAQNITVSNVNTYSGHGISIGSITKGGLTNMLVQNITQMGTANDSNGIGIRIKAQQSNGGLVQNVTYQNICSANNKVALYLSPYYSTSAGTSYPSLQNIIYRNIHVINEGGVTLEGYQNSTGTVTNTSTITLDNVIFDALHQSDFSPAEQNLAVTVGPGPVSPLFLSQTGTNITYTGSVTNPGEAPYPCSAANFQYLVGELFASTSAATSLKTETLNAPTSVTLNAMLQPAMSQVTYASISSGGTYTGTPAPTTAVQFLEGSTVVGTGTLGGNGTIATATLTGVLPGTHTYTAAYPGDTTYTNPLAFGSVTVTVVGVPTTTTVTTSGSLVYGAANSVVATIAGTSGTPTGMVQFFDGTTSLGTVSLSGGIATLPLPLTLLPGSHSFNANYLGDTTFATSSGAAAAASVISVAPSSTTATASSVSINPNATSTLTITVAGVTGGAVPSGMVTVLDGTTTAGTGMLSGGKATVVVTLATLGSHNLVLTYGGDRNYAISSGAISVAVVPQFTLAATPATVTIAANGASTPTLTVTPGGGFSGSVAFTCSSPAVYVTCAIGPGSVTVSGTTPQTALLILTVAPSVSQLREPTGKNAMLWAMLLPLSLLGLAGRRKVWGRGLLALAMAVLLGGAMSGCGSGTSTKLPPAGTQVVTVTATGGAIAPTVQVSVMVSN